MTDKFKHVRQARQTRQHLCHWPDCKTITPPAMWGCKKHWYMLPRSLRTQIWATYEAGQEETLTPSKSYLAVAKKVDAWIRENFR